MIFWWMNFPIKRSQKFPRNLPIRVKSGPYGRSNGRSWMWNQPENQTISISRSDCKSISCRVKFKWCYRCSSNSPFLIRVALTRPCGLNRQCERDRKTSDSRMENIYWDVRVSLFLFGIPTFLIVKLFERNWNFLMTSLYRTELRSRLEADSPMTHILLTLAPSGFSVE